MKLLATSVLLVAIAPLLRADPPDAREALQELQDYIGVWNGSGTSEKDRSLIWKERVNWRWDFKAKEPSLAMSFPQGKYYKKGQIRYLPAAEKYELSLISKEDKRQVFLGDLKKGKLVVERKDETSGETQQIVMNMAGGGIRMVYTYLVKPPDRTFFNKQFQVSFTKEGESFGTAVKKNECVVTGGLGTMPVSYNGMTYYVCCSGCRDAFNENPDKMIKEYLARKKKSQ